VSAFWTTDESPSDVVNGRYRLPDPVTGEPTSFTRASNMGAVLADAFGLTRWQLREQLRGVGLRPDLQRLVSTFGHDTPKGDLDEVTRAAHEAAATGAKANNGTAIHAVLAEVDRAWREDDIDPEVTGKLPEWSLSYVASYVRELRRHGLEPIPTMVERRVCHRAVGVVGTFDNLYRESDASIVVGDKKTTGHLDLSASEIAVQLSCYAGAGWIWDDAARTWGRLMHDVRQDRAVVVHVDQEHATVSLYRVDLEQGRRALNLAAQVREWRNTKALLLPYVAPQVVPGFTEQESRELINSTKVDPFANIPNADDAANERTEQASDEAAVAYPNAGNEGNGDGPTADAIASTPVTNGRLRTAEDLLRQRVTKGDVQQYAREHGITDLAHNKKVLIQMLEAAGKLAPAGTPTPPTSPGKGDPAEIHGPINGSDPTNPHDPAFHEARLREIARADTVGALELIRRRVVRVGGDQAWTDAMVSAARARVAELDNPLAADDPGAMMSYCATPQDLATLWEQVTIGGTLPERWTDELNVAAQARLAEISAATPPAPVNPFVATS